MALSSDGPLLFEGGSSGRRGGRCRGPALDDLQGVTTGRLWRGGGDGPSRTVTSQFTHWRRSLPHTFPRTNGECLENVSHSRPQAPLRPVRMSPAGATLSASGRRWALALPCDPENMGRTSLRLQGRGPHGVDGIASAARLKRRKRLADVARGPRRLLEMSATAAKFDPPLVSM
jgi:hypothetical protein